MEAATATMVTFGAAALLASWLWLLAVSWKEDYAWGLCTLFLPPLSYCYGLARLDKAAWSCDFENPVAIPGATGSQYGFYTTYPTMAGSW